MTALGEAVASWDRIAADGLDSSGVGPFGRFRVRPTDNPPVPWAARPEAEPAPAADDDAWVLGCIQEAFETPAHISGAWSREPALRAPRRPLALPPAPPAAPAPPARTPLDVPQTGAARAGERLARVEALAAEFTPAVPVPAAMAAAPRPLPLLDLGRVIDVDALYREDRAPAVDPAAAVDDELLAQAPRRVRRIRRWARTGLAAGKFGATAVATIFAVTLLLSNGALGLLPFRGSYVVTGSMSPGMPVGSLVISEKVPASAVHKGDVITFAHPTKPGVNETHRVYAVMLTEKGEMFVTKGDANGSPDSWRIPRTGRIWKRVASFKGLGYPLGWLQEPRAHLAVTLIPAFALAAWILSWVWKPVLAAKKLAERI